MRRSLDRSAERTRPESSEGAIAGSGPPRNRFAPPPCTRRHYYAAIALMTLRGNQARNFVAPVRELRCRGSHPYRFAFVDWKHLRAAEFSRNRLKLVSRPVGGNLLDLSLRPIDG